MGVFVPVRHPDSPRPVPALVRVFALLQGVPGPTTGLRRRIAREQHLSVTSGILGPRAMRALGLPMFVLPWYPLIRIPFNASRSAAALLPGGMERAAARGRCEQRAFLRTMTGDASATIGESATVVGQAA